MRPRAAIDWDGTCVENKWPLMGEWLTYAPEALRHLSRYYRVLIHTSRIAPVEIDYVTPRSPDVVRAEINSIQEMLDDEGLREVEIHTGPFKPGAEFYLDDKAIRFTGAPNAWKNLMPRLVALANPQATEAELFPTLR